MTQKLEIRLPEGTFHTYCEECAYAHWDDTDSQHRIFCSNPMFYHYVHPTGCSYGKRG